MSPRFVARDRLELALSIVALAFDRDGVSVAEAADVLGVSEHVIVETVAPITDLEYVSTSGRLLDDIGHAVRLDDGTITVDVNWLSDLSSISPGEAALLIAMIDTADLGLGIDSATLMGLRRRLEPLASLFVNEAVPEAVTMLLASQRSGFAISARKENLDNIVDRDWTLHEVHGVQCTGKGWRVLTTPYPSDPSVQVSSVRLESLHDLKFTDRKFERRFISAVPEYVGSSRAIDVELDVPSDQSWLLSYFDPEIVERVDDRVIARVTIDGEAPLRRLLLRLGPDSKVISPPEAASIAVRAAERVLALYQEE